MDWLSGNLYVGDGRGIIYLVKVVLPLSSSDSSRERYLSHSIAIIYNGTAVPRAVKVHPVKG